MTEIEMNLFLGLAEEHKQRTGHDIFRTPKSYTHINCDVCLNLDAIDRKRLDEERAHYDEMAKR